MHDNSIWNKKFESKEDEVNLLKKHAFHEWIYPEDVFKTIEFLVHNQNVVNTEIILDGGQKSYFTKLIFHHQPKYFDLLKILNPNWLSMLRVILILLVQSFFLMEQF